jgi:hypothetical protein
MVMITFNVSENTAFDRMYHHYWFDSKFIEQTPHLTTSVVETWMDYTLENYGIRPLGPTGNGIWEVVDEQKYALMLLKWT